MEEVIIIDDAEKEASEVLSQLSQVHNVRNHQEQVITSEESEPTFWETQVEIVVTAQTTDRSESSLKENNSPPESGDIEIPPLPSNEGNTGSAKRKKKATVRKCGRPQAGEDGCGTWRLETSPLEVRRRFELGCECSDDSCFRGLNPDSVYKHRLNIAELTKEEHDMYLMGVTMACMADPEATVKRRARTRLRAQYVYAGRRVCLQAFLYLENVTLYQLKRIRKHVVTHGVTPRIHGNHGKKPHNVFSLDTYRRATTFLKFFIEQHTSPGSSPKAAVQLPPDITRKSIHDTYREYVERVAPPNEKVMGYSTFRHFIKEQFPNLRFAKVDGFCGTHSANKSVGKTASTQPASSVSKAEKQPQETAKVATLDVASLPIIFAGTSSDKPAYFLPVAHFSPVSFVATNGVTTSLKSQEKTFKKSVKEGKKP